ncbi:CBS domain-containing protein [Pelagibacterium montanilacus]|uniref:CBS domain-containing protein n=1 Tax=Pelagibacterium montanilacus TaxID=2185280 RepID=UPI000F8DBB32|nr:CBS domain-containing protein [Pelagibacterium montanilacus]
MFIEAIIADKGRDVVTIGIDASVADLVATLAEHNIGAVIVCDDAGKPKGIVSERDVVRQLARSAADLMDRPVSTIMTRNVQSCALTDTIDAAMGIMTRGRFRHLPVMDGGELVGIVSIGDVVKRKIAVAEEEAGALRDYISAGV